MREKGTMNGMITTNENYDLEEILPKLKDYKVVGVVEKVSCKEKETYKPGDIGSEEVPVERKVVVIDVGTKKNIIRCLLTRGCEVTVYPQIFAAQDVLAEQPDGIMITNGPGDPSECTAVIEQIRVLAGSGIPIYATCLAHQLMALAHDAKTYKMKYGHRGANHPVKNLETGKVYISSQNHGYVGDADSIDKSVAEMRCFSLRGKFWRKIMFRNFPPSHISP